MVSFGESTGTTGIMNGSGSVLVQLRDRGVFKGVFRGEFEGLPLFARSPSKSKFTVFESKFVVADVDVFDLCLCKSKFRPGREVILIYFYLNKK
jgi:hypothetical protein